MAEGSGPNTLEFLRDFYDRAYDKIRAHVEEDKYVVFHDGFQLTAWKDFVTQPKYKNIMLDTHQYLMVAEAMGCEQTPDGYVAYIKENFEKLVEEVQQYVPVVCGEWCLFNSYTVGMDTKGGQSVLNGVDFSGERNILSEEEKKEVFQKICKAHLDAWKKGSGYFYWSYKLLLDTVNDPNWFGWDSWDFGKSVDQGWFTQD
jgi:hypothetical protein